jgi:hypothetical protein
MRALVVIFGFLVSACTGVTQVRGPYAAQLSQSDIRQIRRLVAPSPHWGHRVIFLRAVQRDRVGTETRDYEDSGYSGIRRYVVRRGTAWFLDENSSVEGVSEWRVVTY